VIVLLVFLSVVSAIAIAIVGVMFWWRREKTDATRRAATRTFADLARERDPRGKPAASPVKRAQRAS
jgi:hypothetical protein